MMWLDWIELNQLQKNFLAISTFALCWYLVIQYASYRFRKSLKVDQLVHVKISEDKVLKCKIIRLSNDGTNDVVVVLDTQKVLFTLRSNIFDF